MRRAGRSTMGWLLVLLLVTLPLAAVTPSAHADEDKAGSENLEGYALGGPGVCVECHDETDEYPVLSIFKTRHAVVADERTPLASVKACQSCHGPSKAHVEDSDVKPGVVFSADQPAEAQNEACQGCHKSGLQLDWAGSPHAGANVSCVSCHRVHAQEDPMLKVTQDPTRWRHEDSQAETCFNCHADKRALINRISSHPIREGKVRCSDCHNPHGSKQHALKGNNVNETCYNCHAEKRGPFLWEHAPAREDCTNCHNPHGSNTRPMLKARVASLCLQCHVAAYHPSDSYDGSDLPPSTSGSRFIGRSCLGCHTEVHGSNHPSGVRWTR